MLRTNLFLFMNQYCYFFCNSMRNILACFLMHPNNIARSIDRCIYFSFIVTLTFICASFHNAMHAFFMPHSFVRLLLFFHFDHPRLMVPFAINIKSQPIAIRSSPISKRMYGRFACFQRLMSYKRFPVATRTRIIISGLTKMIL